MPPKFNKIENTYKANREKYVGLKKDNENPAARGIKKKEWNESAELTKIKEMNNENICEIRSEYTALHRNRASNIWLAHHILAYIQRTKLEIRSGNSERWITMPFLFNAIRL